MSARPDPTTDAILAAMTRLGEADAKVIAAEAHVAYSTTAKKLRGLAADGRAHRRDNDPGAALWRTGPATEPGDVSPDPHHGQSTTEPGTAPSPAATTTGPDHDPAPGPAFEPPSPDIDPTDHAGADAEGPQAPPANKPSAGPNGEEPATATRQNDTAPPGSSVAQLPEDTATPPADETPPGNPGTNGSGPDSTEPTDSAQSADTDADAADGSPGGTPADKAKPSATAATPRRGKGMLRDEVLAILQKNPDTTYKVGELSKLLGGASQGAITNALHKLVTDGTVTQTVERPATYQAN